jgi:hypothetical protein
MEIAGGEPDVGQVGGTRDVRKILQLIDEKMNDSLLSLKTPAREEKVGPRGSRVVPLPNRLADDQVGGPRFVFEGHKGDALGGSGALPEEYQTGDAVVAVGGKSGQVGSPRHV